MTIEEAKKASEILQKIDKNNESTFIVLDKELVDTIVKHCLHVLTEEIWELEQELKLL